MAMVWPMHEWVHVLPNVGYARDILQSTQWDLSAEQLQFIIKTFFRWAE